MIGSFEKLVYFPFKKAFLLFFGIVVFFSPESSNKKSEPVSFSSKAFLTDFSHFSPAFFALEDEFFFEDSFQNPSSKPVQKPKTLNPKSTDATMNLDLKNSDHFPSRQNPLPNQKGQVSKNPNLSKKGRQQNKEKSMNQNLSHWLNNQDFDGQIGFSKISHLMGSIPQKTSSKISDAGELREGPLFENIKKTYSLKTDPEVFAIVNPPLSKEIKRTDNNPRESLKEGTPRVFQNSISKNKKPDYKISGELSLKEGLAFIGSMEVQWILSNQILNYGSINIDRGTYEITVDQLLGEIAILIRDKNNKITGLGNIELNQLENNSTQISANIEILPIEWNHAGQVVDGGLLGSKNNTLSGVNISLYGFGEQSQTNKEGQFSFYDWKKLDSRSIAMAEKPGYYDSVFIIDSKKPVSVPLFPKSYIKAFFSYLEDQGLDDVRKGGVVYGSIEGTRDKRGYKVSIANQSTSNQKPIYFFPVGLANPQGTATSSNGLFSFAGLSAGDYQLTIEKEGQIVDQKWVVVEAGKISPVFSPLNQTSSDNGASDGEIHLSSFKNPSLLFEPAGLTEARDHSEAFYKKLHQLAEKQKLQVSKGLVFGFIDSSEKYQVTLLEETPKKIIYFNNKAQVVDPLNEIADGFIMSGFSEGLKSLAIQTTTDKMVLATELIFNDHKSTSLVNTSVYPVEI